MSGERAIGFPRNIAKIRAYRSRGRQGFRGGCERSGLPGTEPDLQCSRPVKTRGALGQSGETTAGLAAPSDRTKPGVQAATRLPEANRINQPVHEPGVESRIQALAESEGGYVS